MGSRSWELGAGRGGDRAGSRERQTRLQAFMDRLYDCNGGLACPSTRLMLAVILFIDYPGPVCGLWCGVMSNCIGGPGVCVYLGEPKDFVEGGGTKSTGGLPDRLGRPGHLHFCCWGVFTVYVHLLPISLLCVFVCAASCCHHCHSLFPSSLPERLFKVIDIVVAASISP